jgi:serine/threonine-protein kinase
MAEVYRAHDRLLDRPVALKVLFPELSVDRSFVERFRREAQAAANLSHQNIVPVFDWGEDGGTYFIVMEFIDGRPLSSILRTAGPLHPDRAAEIGADVAGALDYAHRHGVIHRDVKPGNVLITEEGLVKVTDFGIARAVNTEESLTQTGAVMGTATYFSPEQAEGMGVDSRSDIYSLGVVLFEMVTGRPPFLGESPVAVASKHVREIAPTPREINPAVPVDLEAIILMCMSKSPDDRYSTGDDLRIDLLRFREGRAVAAGTVPIGSQRTTAVGATQSLGAVGIDGTQSIPTVPKTLEDEEPPSRNGLKAGILVVLLAALIAVVAVLGNSVGWWHFTTAAAGQKMPDVVGKTESSAAGTLNGLGLKVKTTTDASSSQPPDIVVGSDPSEGSDLTKGQTVILSLGSGTTTTTTTAPVTVPNLVGETVAAAQLMLQDDGLKSTIKMSTTCADVGLVCSTLPAFKASIPVGGTVTLITAPTPTTTTTPTEVAVPNVVGDSDTAACSSITSLGLTCSASSGASNTVPSGEVISTSPTAGTIVAAGASVSVLVSTGPASDTVPDVIQETQDQAEQTLQNAGLTVAIGSCSQVSTLSNGESTEVTQQSPSPQQTVPPGTQVTLTIETTGTCPGGSSSSPTTTVAGTTTSTS